MTLHRFEGLRAARVILLSASMSAVGLCSAGCAEEAPPPRSTWDVQQVPVSVSPADSDVPLTRVSADMDAVMLRGGGVLRGAITEWLPGDHASVLLPSGYTARVRWEDVEGRETRAPATEASAPTVATEARAEPREDSAGSSDPLSSPFSDLTGGIGHLTDGFSATGPIQTCDVDWGGCD